jgi:guanine deaminase
LIELGPVVESIADEVGFEAATEEGKEDTGNVDVFGWENWEEKIAKWVWNGDDRNVRAVWVSGRLVHKRGV